MIYLTLLFSAISILLMCCVIGAFAHYGEILTYDEFRKLPHNLIIILIIGIATVFSGSSVYAILEIGKLEDKVEYYEKILEPNQYWEYNQEQKEDTDNG